MIDLLPSGLLLLIDKVLFKKESVNNRRSICLFDFELPNIQKMYL